MVQNVWATWRRSHDVLRGGSFVLFVLLMFFVEDPLYYLYY